VTGASRGIGRAIALALAADGANVVINYASSARSAEEVVQTIGAERALSVQGDMSDTSAVKALVAKTVERFGAINILVLNAGLLAGDKSLEKTEEGDYERMFATNVKGPMFLTKVSIEVPQSACRCWICVPLSASLDHKGPVFRWPSDSKVLFSVSIEETKMTAERKNKIKSTS
jgi:NAD(P)-dependent dehydrogenase (short-subunit alcohol dehydrogenase family)